ncbi:MULTISPECIES: hypothetical protein [unclassified Roseateles]|uniref:hypothetical protein n=1 Tax=unclassified Roseateles TaxID=2626991 RepID=UPI0006FC12A9|nr:MULTISPECIES: hypothetical protein [unclassified Roseateles]KQW45665.1 hypothetical protein ASC81_12290 [Pelomonas sp. Root405]KRA72509.1 hypothetical protein ASD88_12290 [Pelomonas sp. Root662]
MTRQTSFNRAVFQLLFASAALVGTAVNAQSYVTDPESGASVGVASTVSRAEVLADLKIYQESGLAAAERTAAETGHNTVELQAARERYAALRQGERYAALVAEYAARRGETVRPVAKA